MMLNRFRCGLCYILIDGYKYLSIIIIISFSFLLFISPVFAADNHNTNRTALTWPLLVYGLVVLAIVGIMLGVSFILGQRHSDKETNQPYESGILTTNQARLRFPAHFYLVAMFFLIFDLEAMFIFAWAVAFRQLGWTAYWANLVFIVILVAVLIYEWKSGALDLETSGRMIIRNLFPKKEKS